MSSLIFNTLWKQIGQDISVSTPIVLFGISNNGRVVAITEPANASNRGRLYVYEISFNGISYSWQTLGLSSEILVGQTTNTLFGGDGNSVISLSTDGRVVAVCDTLNDTSGTDTGQVRVFELSANTWRQRGQLINGKPIASYGLGYNIALSGNGNILAASSLTRPSPRNGEILVYELSGNSWIQMGQDISGVGDPNNDLGFSMSLSLDGTTLAAGYRSSTPSRVEIYRFDSISRRWLLPIDNIINGSDIDQWYFGWNIKLSGDGNTIIIGGIGYPSGDTITGIGSVSVFKYNGTSWSKLGQTIYGASANDQFGQWVQISNDGTIISAGGAISCVRVYKLSSNVWTQIGQVLNGTGVAPNLGLPGHALSGDGTTLFQMINKSGGNLSRVYRVYGIIDNNLNTPNKQWNMYLNTLSSISGDDLTIKPDTRRNLLLEVSGNNNIFIKRGDVSYNLTNLITGDTSFSNVDVSRNLNPIISTITQAQGTGGTITISGGYIIHSFTTTGTSSFTPAFSGNVEVLVVGGGGGGGGSIGGGGGGGGVIYMPSVSVISGFSYEVVVGAGGSTETNGQASRVFDASAAGGGTSGQHDNGIGTAGGSGGGAASNNDLLNQGGATSGNSLGPNRGFIYGNRGGNMTTSRTVLFSGPSRAAGGGGAGGRAVDTDPNIIGDTGQTGAGSGGVGITNSILGTTYYWGGGGGGGSSQTIGSWGGLGGGGGGGGADTLDNNRAGLGGGSALRSGTNGSSGNGGNGGENTGGGGGGGDYNISGGAGGSGIVVIRYLQRLTITTSKLGLSNKMWGNAYMSNINVTNMSVSGTISNIRQIIVPQIANNTSLGNSSNIWQKAFIRDLSGITSINGINWPVIGPRGATGQNGQDGQNGTTPGGPGPPGPPGPTGALGVSINATLTDISNFRITTKNRIYQDISGGINDLSWAAVNGYYGLAKDAYPALNPLSNGVKAVQTWTRRTTEASHKWHSVCWSPELGIFVAVAYFGTNRVMTSPNGINWTPRLASELQSTQWISVCWSPELRLFVAVGAYNGTNRVMRSIDGTTWISSTLGVESQHNWHSVCWSAELGRFLAVANGTNRVMSSKDGITWSTITAISSSAWLGVCWSKELGIFVAVSNNGIVMRSSDGINWTLGEAVPVNNWFGVCWSPELGIFVAVASGGSATRVMYSYNGTNWSNNSITGVNSNIWYSVCWSPVLNLFLAVSENGTAMTSNNGINWTSITVLSGNWLSTCWSPELGIFAIVSQDGTSMALTSSLKGRPPTSYNLFDSSFNRIDENGKWDFSNINVTVLTAGGASVSSDDRLKHNEVNINNGLDIIDQLSPKFYKKTQVLLDASYNGDLSGYAWNYEAGLIAQELLQISDLSFTVGGGDYYEQTYIIRNSNYDLSANNYEVSANNYEVSANNYKLRYNYYEPNANNYEVSANNYEISNNLIAQPYNVNYNSIFVYGLAAIKELHTKVKAQETSILDEQLNDLVTRVEALESNR